MSGDNSALHIWLWMIIVFGCFLIIRSTLVSESSALTFLTGSIISVFAILIKGLDSDGI